jgi:hypothetical protein
MVEKFNQYVCIIFVDIYINRKENDMMKGISLFVVRVDRVRARVREPKPVAFEIIRTLTIVLSVLRKKNLPHTPICFLIDLARSPGIHLLSGKPFLTFNLSKTLLVRTS